MIEEKVIYLECLYHLKRRKSALEVLEYTVGDEEYNRLLALIEYIGKRVDSTEVKPATPKDTA